MRKASEGGRLFLRAALITLAVLALGIGASSLAASKSLLDPGAFSASPMHFVLTGAPFFMLAFNGDDRRPLWVIAAAIMLSFWAFFVWQTRLAYLNDYAGGANIGLGLVMMAAPIFACVVLGIVGRILSWRDR